MANFRRRLANNQNFVTWGHDLVTLILVPKDKDFEKRGGWAIPPFLKEIPTEIPHYGIWF